MFVCVQVVAWPLEEYGKFYNGDSYIILNTYKTPPSDVRRGSFEPSLGCCFLVAILPVSVIPLLTSRSCCTMCTSGSASTQHRMSTGRLLTRPWNWTPW